VGFSETLLAAFSGHYAFEKLTIVIEYLLDIMGIFLKRKLLWVFMSCKSPRGVGFYRNQAPMQGVKHPLVGI
jgi:hypothetical protein